MELNIKILGPTRYLGILLNILKLLHVSIDPLRSNIHSRYVSHSVSLAVGKLMLNTLQMCGLDVLDHTSRYGCGHFWILDLNRCYAAQCRGQFSGCIHPLRKSITPYSKEWQKWVNYFRPGYAKIATVCIGCRSGNHYWDAPY